MEESGEVMHLAKSGRLIVKLGTAGKETKSGELLVDENGKRIGKVIEVINRCRTLCISNTTDRQNKQDHRY